MFSLYDRTVMHAYGEALKKWTWFWGPAPSTTHSHDWARSPLRSTPWLHRRIDVDYSGWWMCLIPTAVIREIGLSLPLFIKWDDAEFGLRAGEAGFPTVSLPGAAVWHVPWTEKDDTIDWQAYFHERNRLISALLHSPYDHGGRLVLESLTNHVKRLVSMQYGTGELIMLALEDVLDGPERMHRDMGTRLPRLREMVKSYDDGRSNPALDLYPKPRMKKPPRHGKGIANPTKLPGKVKMAATGLVRQFTPPRELSSPVPGGHRPACRPAVVPAGALRLGHRVGGRRDLRRVVPPRSTAVHGPDAPYVRAACPALQGVAGAQRPLQGCTGSADLPGGLEGLLRGLRRRLTPDPDVGNFLTKSEPPACRLEITGL